MSLVPSLSQTDRLRGSQAPLWPKGKKLPKLEACPDPFGLKMEHRQTFVGGFHGPGWRILCTCGIYSPAASTVGKAAAKWNRRRDPMASIPMPRLCRCWDAKHGEPGLHTRDDCPVIKARGKRKAAKR